MIVVSVLLFSDWFDVAYLAIVGKVHEASTDVFHPHGVEVKFALVYTDFEPLSLCFIVPVISFNTVSPAE